ncbi:ABC transporter ATP-binding protein [candidate division KSB1 bacterium]|nr:ABC transporter ATP-binding protein [candidate division KSB1 bacterium]
MIKLENITKWYSKGFIPKKVEILKGVTLTVNKGDVFGYLGPNGAGKTTTIKILLNLLKSDKGSAQINGIDVTNPKSRQSVGYLPEQPCYYDYLTGKEFLDYCGSLFRIQKQSLQKKIDELLEKVGLENARNTHLRKYSRGMLQRIGIAQALINDPEVLILDEPLSGLDPHGRKDVLDIIIEQKNKGNTIFFSSHILADAESLCDKIGIINEGVLIAEGDIDTVLDRESASAGVEIVYTTDLTGIYEEFGKFGNIDKLQENKYRLTMEDKYHVNDILEKLISSGAEILSVNRHRLTLEELYLKKIR